jgi:hypothetical protein
MADKLPDPWFLQYGPLIAASATFLAAIVALFKESIIGIWRKPTLNPVLEFGGKFKEILSHETEDEDSTTEPPDPTIKVDAYDLILSITNKGREPCKNAEIYLERVEMKKTGDVQFIDYDGISGKAIKWAFKDQSSIDLPPFGGRSLCNVIRISSPENRSRSRGGKPTQVPGLQIGDIQMPERNMAADFIIHFAVYALNHKPKRLKIMFKWTGNWKARITEFSTTVTVSMEVK